VTEAKKDKNFAITDMIEWSKSIFIAIFAMMTGAMASGNAQQFGPDVGKATQAALNIFGIIDIPSEINAMESQAGKKQVEPAVFKGEIEFQNVWFRYPTRKSDWILRGLNMKIS
jgi:ATP-binding cassette subfamily B (MDR/TAP) protein 1